MFPFFRKITLTRLTKFDFIKKDKLIIEIIF